jgi:elongation factor G
MSTQSTKGSANRVIALVGPQSGGKTTLLEAILKQTGRLGSVGKGAARAFGDTSAESKARDMGIDVNFATTEFMGDAFSFVDCPGATELAQDQYSVLCGVDAAILVTEPEPDKIMGLSPLLKHLELNKIPHYIFVNKIDRSSTSIPDLASMLNTVTKEQVLLRQIPIIDDDRISGYIDLASERAYVYQDGAPSDVVETPGSIQEAFSSARYSMLESLADFDEHLMEELLEDITPPKEEIFHDLSSDLQQDLIIPVFMGSALKQNGVFRLLKALRHEAPNVSALQERLALENSCNDTVAQVLQTVHTSHGGKLSVARVLRGEVSEGDVLNGCRVAGISHLHGDKTEKLSRAAAGELVGLARMEDIKTGDVLTEANSADVAIKKSPVLDPVYSMALQIENRNDEVKLATSLAKLCDEDPSLIHEQVADTHQTVLRGQGEIHLQIATEKLNSKYGLKVTTQRPKVPYKETIRSSVTHHSRYKKQSGGHGQYGDVVVEIAPLSPGEGFSFGDRITGGAVPKQYIPSVEAGVKEYLSKGPLGFPVVDVGVVLTDGSYHAVDSSDMAFKTAGRLAMSEALPGCKPVLLEPVMEVHIYVPSEYTPKVNGLVSSRRGQILGFDSRKGWDGWDDVYAFLPESELQDIIIELRSMTQGSGTYSAKFDHLTQLTGRLADQVMTQSEAAG